MIRVCVVGTGQAAATHVRTLRAIEPGARVRVVGRDPVRAAAWAREHGAHGSYATVEEAAGADDDVLVVATPPSSHARYVDLAMAARKHVLVEKPAFRTLAELEARLPALRAYDRAFMVAENAHFSPLHRTIVARVRAGAVGTPVVVSLRRLRRRVPAASWKAGAEETDGALHEGGVHCVRVGLALSGVARRADVASVFAAAPGRKLVDNAGDDTAHVTWRTADGLLGELWHSWGLEGGRAPLRSFVAGTDGAVHFDVLGRFAAISRGQRWPPVPLLPWAALRAGEDLGGTSAMWRSFLASARTGSPVEHTVDEAEADLAVVDAAYRALRAPVALVP